MRYLLKEKVMLTIRLNSKILANSQLKRIVKELENPALSGSLKAAAFACLADLAEEKLSTQEYFIRLAFLFRAKHSIHNFNLTLNSIFAFLNPLEKAVELEKFNLRSITLIPDTLFETEIKNNYLNLFPLNYSNTSKPTNTFIDNNFIENVADRIYYYLNILPENLQPKNSLFFYNTWNPKSEGWVNSFKKNKINLTNPNPQESVILHEYFHYLEVNNLVPALVKEETQKLYNISRFSLINKLKVIKAKSNLIINNSISNNFPSSYASKNLSELLAELFTAYILYGDICRSLPENNLIYEAYQILKKYLFQGIEYTRDIEKKPYFYCQTSL